MGQIKPKEYYNEFFEQDKKYHAKYDSTPYYELWQTVFKAVKQFKKKRILELGCGTGQFAEMLYDNEFKYYLGLDFSDVGIRIAEERVPAFKFQVMDLLNIDRLNYDYEALICLETFEHTYDLKIISMLKRKTPIVFTVPNFDAPAHDRFFKDAEQVKEHYSELLDLTSVHEFENYFIGKGVVY